MDRAKAKLLSVQNRNVIRTNEKRKEKTMKKTKKFILGILVSVMILSTGIVAYANTSEHICCESCRR